MPKDQETCPFCRHELPIHHAQCYLGNLPSACETEVMTKRPVFDFKFKPKSEET